MNKLCIIFSFIATLLLTSCGQTGPLYLPQSNQSPPDQNTKYGL